MICVSITYNLLLLFHRVSFIFLGFVYSAVHIVSLPPQIYNTNKALRFHFPGISISGNQLSFSLQVDILVIGPKTFYFLSWISEALKNQVLSRSAADSFWFCCENTSAFTFWFEASTSFIFQAVIWACEVGALLLAVRENSKWFVFSRKHKSKEQELKLWFLKVSVDVYWCINYFLEPRVSEVLGVFLLVRFYLNRKLFWRSMRSKTPWCL